MSQNVTAEMALLGAFLIEPEAMTEVPWLKPVHFCMPVHGLIFAAIGRTMMEHDGRFDLVLLVDEIGDEIEQLAIVGGVGYFQQLIDGCPSSKAAPHYARIVLEHAARRHVAIVAQQMIYEAKADVEAAIEKCVKELGSTLAAYRKAMK